MATPALPPSQDISLPVSLGEALDKLTILDIKLQRISDPKRRADVQKEYDLLMATLKPYVDAYPYHYRVLLAVNLAIWDTQDKFHGKDTTPEEGAVLCRHILTENDRRFRVKAKINALANSALREQKGYAVKKAFIYTHLGLGDMYWMNGAVRYLATAYDEVVVVCKKKYLDNVMRMYSDDPAISLLSINGDEELHPWPRFREALETQGFTVYGCGFFAPNAESATSKGIYELPNSFYDDLGLSRDMRRTYFHVPRTEAAAALAACYTGTPYIVVHQQSSNKKLDIVGTLRAAGESRLILDLNENHYAPGSPEHELAELAVNKPLASYTTLMEGAEELHMIESSIYCMASHLDLSRVKRKICYDPWGGNAERLGVFTTGPAVPEMSKAAAATATA